MSKKHREYLPVSKLLDKLWFKINLRVLNFKDQLIELHQGQGMEIWFRDKYVCPSEEEYNQLVIKSKLSFNSY